MNKKKISVSLINSILLFVFLVVVTLSILVSSYYNTKKVISKNINDYFNQTSNLISLILKSEQRHLELVADKFSFLYANGNYNSLDDVIIDVELFESFSDIDLVYLVKDDITYDYSQSLFDVEEIQKKIKNLNLSSDKAILVLKIQDENISLILNVKKIIDPNTGRITSTLYLGKLINDNLNFINLIKEEARLNDVFIYSEKQLLISSNMNEEFNINNFKDSDIYKTDDFIYGKKQITTYRGKKIDFIFVETNESFVLLQEFFLSKSYFLLFFVLASFAMLYFLSNTFLIKPFEKLINYANDIKNKKSTKFEETNILEIDNFANEIKEIINELTEIKEKYSRAINGVQDGLWDVNLKTKEVFYSNRFIEMLGFDENDKINNRHFWQKSIHKDDFKLTIEKLKEHLKGKSKLFENEYRFKCKDASFKWIKIRGKVLFDDYGKPDRITGFHTDIDDLKTLQEENLTKEQMLYQQSKLASMGEMIGNIAHQWRQPLSVISMIASSMKLELQLGIETKEDKEKNIQKMLDTISYISSIIDKFRNFFNPNNVCEEFYLQDAFEENLEILETSYKMYDIHLILNVENIKILSYKFELMQVLLNLLNNSRDALKANNLKDKYIFIRTIVDNDKVIIKIIDNAGGIPDNIKNKIYEPYFTTKHQSQGTGLGLYMSNEIVKRHLNGKLTNKTKTFIYKDKEFTGEEFSLELPL